MYSKRFVYYQPNEKDLKDHFGDCTIRALAKVLDVSWLEAFDLTIPLCRREQVESIFGCDIELRKKLLGELGFEYVGVSNKRGTKRPTVDTFAKEHPQGRYICNVVHHVVAVVDGKFYDTWDSGDCSLYGYFEYLYEVYSGKYHIGEIVDHRGHECRITRTWCVDGKNGLSIIPTGGYGFEVDLYEEQLQSAGV